MQRLFLLAACLLIFYYYWGVSLKPRGTVYHVVESSSTEFIYVDNSKSQKLANYSADLLSAYESEPCRSMREVKVGNQGNIGGFGKAKCSSGSIDSPKEHGDSVLLSTAYNVIYIPNMKCASSSIENYMFEKLNASRVGTHFLGNMGHRFPLERYRIFTFVRDPTSMFFSAYAELDKRWSLPFRDNSKLSFMTIDRNMENEPRRAISALNTIRNRDSPNAITANLFSHLYSQTWKTQRCIKKQPGIRKYWRDPESKIHSKALQVANFLGSQDNMESESDQLEFFKLDFIGRMEFFQQDFQFLQDTLGLPRGMPPRLQVHERDPASKHAKMLKKSIPIPLVQAICEYYASDFACFGYSKPCTNNPNTK